MAAQVRADEPVALAIRARSPEFARCFDPGALQERIAHYRRADSARAAELRLELSVDGPDTADLQLFRGDALVSRRRFEQLPQPCADRRDAVALSIALALEGAARELAPAGDPASYAAVTARANASGARESAASNANAAVTEPRETQTQAPSEPEPPAPRAVTQPSAAEGSAAGPRDSAEEAREAGDQRASATGLEAVHVHMGARGLAEALPAPVWTGVLGLELWLNRRISVDLSAIASTVGNSEFAGATAQTQLVGGELFGCAAWKIGSFSTQGCLGATAAACTARGAGYPVPLPSTTLPWVASAARFGLRWPDQGLIALRLILQAHLNLVRPELSVEGFQEQLSPSWVGGSGGLDMILALE